MSQARHDKTAAPATGAAQTVAPGGQGFVMA